MKKSRILYHLIKEREVSVKKIANLTTGYYAMLRKNLRPKNYPSVLMIEPTNLCNLQCPLCPLGRGLMKRKKGMMKFEAYKEIIDRLGDYLFNLTLFNFGESFINPEIYDMIEYAKKKGIFVRVSTNGHFFNNKEQVRRMVKARMDNLIIALDGASQETLSKYRRNCSFESLKKGIKNVVEVKKEEKSDLPYIEIQFIIMKHNEHEIPKMKMLAKELGVNKLTLKTVMVEEVDFISEEEKKQYLPENKKYSRYDDKIRVKGGVKNYCIRLWISSVIDWDGTVVPCCYDPYERFKMGNVFEEDFIEIWRNKKYQDFRKTILANKKSIKMCENCPGTLMGLTLD